jgi:hypothetical protein
MSLTLSRAARQVAELRQQLAALDERVTLNFAAANPGRYRAVQARADSAYHAFGKPGAPAPMTGETLLRYRRRLLRPLIQYSPTWRQADLMNMGDALDVAEGEIYEHAKRAAPAPTASPASYASTSRQTASAGASATSAEIRRHGFSPSPLSCCTSPASRRRERSDECAPHPAPPLGASAPARRVHRR